MSFKETYKGHWQGIKWSSLMIHIFLLAMYCSVYAQEENNGTSSRSPSSISDSYSRASVKGSQYTGGLLGKVTGNVQISNTYSAGYVTGTESQTGGLIGGIEGISTVMASYWDTLTSRQQASAGGEGRNKTKMTYPYPVDTYMGWNFQDSWHADAHNENDGYPFLGASLPSMYPLVLQVNPAAAGQVTGDGNFTSETKTLVTAHANPAYTFLHWRNLNGTIVSEDPAYIVTMAGENLTLVAQFKLGTGVEDFEEQMHIFPNPFSDYIQIQNTDGIYALSMSTLHGVKLLQTNISANASLDTKMIPSGIYILSLAGKNGKVFKYKIMKI